MERIKKIKPRLSEKFEYGAYTSLPWREGSREGDKTDGTPSKLSFIKNRMNKIFEIVEESE
jgi:hypothetical protein